MTDDSIRSTEAEFLRGLHRAVLTIFWVVLISIPVGKGTVHALDLDRPVALQAAAYCALVAIAITGTVFHIRRRGWEQWRIPAIVVALSASAVACASLPSDHVVTAENWAFGTVGWAGVTVLLDRPMRDLICFLGAHEVITAVNLVVSGAPDQASALNFIAGSIGTIGFPLACGVAATALRGVARRAEENRRDAAQSRTKDRVSAARHAAGQRRYADLSVTTVPLLQGLAGGSLDPADPSVQQQCWIEAARMRRLFAEADEVPDPLVHELGQPVKTAQRLGIRAELKAFGNAAHTPLEIRRTFAEITLKTLLVAKAMRR